MKYILDHTVLLNRSFIDILLLIITLAAMISLFFYCRKKIKDMQELKEELESRLSAFDAEEAFKALDNEKAPEPVEEPEQADIEDKA